MANKYKRNKLKQVIIRLDFEKITLGKLNEFYKGDLKEKFPLQREETIYQGDFEVNLKDNNVISNKQESSKIYIFENKKKTKKLAIYSNYLYIQYLAYSNSEELFEDIKLIITPLIELLKISSINRIGLRYENVIKLKEKDPLSWEKYINNHLLGQINFINDVTSSAARAMGQIILKEDFGDLTFNFGIWNPEFPNKITQKEFILDYDCYSRLPFIPSEEDILKTVKAYQKFIEYTFEKSITEQFRKLLNK